MNWDQIQGHWKQLRGHAKQRWAHLTDEDLKRIDGRRDQLVVRLQDLYGMSQQEAISQAETFRRTIG